MSFAEVVKFFDELSAIFKFVLRPNFVVAELGTSIVSA